VERTDRVLRGRVIAGAEAFERRFVTRTVADRRLRTIFDALETLFAMCALAFMIGRFVRRSAKMFNFCRMTAAKLPRTSLLTTKSGICWASRSTAPNRLFFQEKRVDSLRFEKMPTCAGQVDMGRLLGLAQ
jgi:hypothetical protein